MKKYPLSNAQIRIWYAQQKYENSTLYNIGGVVRINGYINTNALIQAITEVIRENSALRLQFIIEDNQVYQYISSEAYMTDFIDFSSNKDPQEDFKEWCQDQAQRPFLMLGEPLYYFSVFKVSEFNYGYFIKIHHIIADGWSMKLLTDQITKRYEDIVGTISYDNVNKPSYIDYVFAEDRYIASTDIIKAKNYWRSMFSPLPDGCTADLTNKLNGQRTTFVPDVSLQVKIEEYIKKHNISLNTFFIYIYLLYEYKKNGTRDVIVGTPLLGRTGKIQRQTFGTFTNTMPYRYVVDEKMPLMDMLMEVSVDLNNNFRHQKYPYNLLQEELRLNQNGIESLYNVCINYYNTVLHTTIDGNYIENTEFYNGQQEYALQIIIRHWDNIKLQLDFDYQTAIYSKKQIEEMYNQLVILINQVLGEDAVMVGDLCLLEKAEKIKYIDDFNQTEKAYPVDKTWINFFDEIVNKKPNYIAVSQKDENITYKKLNHYSDIKAGYLRSAGVRRGDIVAVIPKHQIRDIITIIAVMKCGGVYLPIDTNTPVGRINEILHDSKAKFMIADQNDCRYDGRFIDNKEPLYLNFNGEHINLSSPSGIAYIIYTSGSTGIPKGVMISHKNLMNYLWWAKNVYLKNEKEVFALYSSYAFDFTMTSIFLPLISGGEIRIYDHAKEKNIFHNIVEDRKVTIAKITPSHIALINDVRVKNSAIHTFIVGGENLKVKVCRSLCLQFGENVNVYNEYGPTEATIGCMTYLCSKVDERSIPIGRPISNTQIYLLDQDMQPVPYDTLGEIYIGGDGVAQGYYQDDKETDKRFMPDPFIRNAIIYKTGDMAYRDESGEIIFAGRCDSELKVRGNRVNLCEIEQKILSSGMVKDVVVKGINREEHSLPKYFNAEVVGKNIGIHLCAYILQEDIYDRHSLRKYLENHLPDYMIPEFIIPLEEFPVTLNGKVDTRKLPDPFIDSENCRIDHMKGRNSEYDICATSEEVNILLDAVQDIIVDKNISIDNNFYAIGGDSIKAIQVSSRLSEKGYELTVRDILTNPVLYGMISYMKPKTSIHYEQGICSGEILKLPITTWFLEQRFHEEGHYNQSVLLELKQKVSIETLNKVFSELIKHHDMLRANYDKDTGVLYYNNEHLDKKDIVEVVHLYKTTDIDFIKVIEENVNHVFDLKKHLLIRPYLMIGPEKSYLFITVHHLVVDGISWRILLEDTVTVLSQTVEKQTVKLHEKTSSYMEYARQYNQWADELQIDENYWHSIIEGENCKSFYINQKTFTYGQINSKQFELGEDITDKLLGRANVPYNTRPYEILLIALVCAIKDLFHTEKMIVEVESHGRDVMENIDVNRTIGWFTDKFPILLKINTEDLQDLMKSLKDQIKRAVKKGCEYGILSNLKNQSAAVKKHIRFNYLGEYVELHNDYFLLKQVFFDSDVNRANYVPYLVDVNVIVINKKLVVLMQYSEEVIDKNLFDNLSLCFKSHLLNIINHCICAKERIYTPTDFDMVDLSQDEIDSLLR